ncbi:MAG: nuclear transport factor 2 family protein [Prosthecobacter sp.]
MKPWLVCFCLLFAVQTFAEDTADLKIADKTRVAAMQSGDRAKLDAVFSDDLRYAHSNGIVDTKKSFIEILAAKKTKYMVYEYEEQNFTFPAPGMALMTGRAHIKADAGGTIMDGVLSFLAVWRKEQGQWRFLAWQSCRMPAGVKESAQ